MVTIRQLVARLCVVSVITIYRQVLPQATIFRMAKERWAQIGITTEFLIVVRALGEFFRLRHVHGANFSTAVAALYVGGALNRGLLLLGGRDLVLLPTLYAVRLDYASHRTRSAGIQNCRDRLVVATRFSTSHLAARVKAYPITATLCI